MSNHENDLLCNIKNKVEGWKRYNQHENIKMYPDKEVQASISESQDFCLKLSQDSAISDSQDVVINDLKNTIVISDSSSECSSPKCSSNLKYKSKNHFNSQQEVCIVHTSDSDSSDTQEKEYLESWRKNEKPNFIANNKNRINITRKHNALFTSDDDNSISNSEQSEQCIESSIKTKSTYFSYSPDSNVRVTSKSNTQLHIKTVNKRNLLLQNAGSSVGSKSSKSTNQASKALSSKCQSDGKKKLTQKDAQNIMKTIKSTRIIYESPRRENNVIINESIDSGMHPAISLKNNLKKTNIIIDETLNSESDVISDTQRNSTNLYKNHVNKYFNASHVDKNVDTMCTALSDRKKKQISEWLMTNSPDSKSDTSFSMVPASNKNDISSGNSSLERLEMNYETPNNREKIRQTLANEKRVINEENNKIIESPAIRQTTILDYTKRSKNNALELRTLNNRTNNNGISTPTTNKPQNVDVTDCADILDKLYGKSWREKAGVLFPISEPRKQIVPTKSRAVQTERKIKNKQKIYTSESEDESPSREDLKSRKCIMKKNAPTNVKQKDSFINDEILSESECESSYYTALTNPRTSTNSTKRKPKLPSTIKKAIAICDSDTEDEDNNHNQAQDLRRKKLCFSADDSDGSSTSEFDPGDDIPIKSKTRKDLIKISRQIPKTYTAIKPTSDIRKYEKNESFLASLSENVPLANAHPDAKKYRTNYKNNKEDLSKYLYKLYNDKVFDTQLPKDLSIEWNVRMRGTAGYCYNKKSVRTLGGVMRSSRIVLSTKVLDTPDRLRDTLIHEMCHAAAWLINSVSDGHGPFWTGWANKAMKTFPELPPIRRCHDYKIKTKFTYKCVGCGYSIGRHSKSLDIEKKRCGHCYGKFELLLNKTTKSGTVQVQTPKREINGFALYVKENYNTIKKKRNIRHAEVMKILGQQFSAVKIAKQQGNLENDPNTPG
ncbi:PREDICTED: dentin sialophosphoprotein [Dufourea novaeangliae]|uniref:dentin sialophosphoprotein n=1 Tax=Dufourea novaeangliae TaxID=178035 RepID=UPI000767687E|nr:PREDICTED: dentin sialophosphoprotein [Dufourea novaeangliae]